MTPKAWGLLGGLVVLLLLTMCGCGGPSAPAFYSIDEAFSESERETIRAAVAAWCEAGAACPEEAMFSEEAHFELVDDLPEDERTERACPEGRTCSTNGRESRGKIEIARNRRSGLDVLWSVAAHEFGHVCIKGHRADSALMTSYQGEGGPLKVDAKAVEYWHEGCP